MKYSKAYSSIEEMFEDLDKKEEEIQFKGIDDFINLNSNKEDVVETLEPTTYNKTVKLQLRISAKVTLPGPVTNKVYIWERSGAIVEVDEEDSAGLLAKRYGDKPCCGGDPDNLKLFVLVE